jgi:hypothetical protein
MYYYWEAHTQLAIRSAPLLFFPSHLNLTYIRILMGYVLPRFLKIYSFSEFLTGLTEMDLAPALYKSYTIFLTEMSDVTNQLHTALTHVVSETHSYPHQDVSFFASLIIHTTGTVLLLLLLLLYVPDD